MKELRFARKSDFLIICILVCLSLLIYLLPFRNSACLAQISVDHQILATISLNDERARFSIAGADGFLFTVADGAISIDSAPCQNQICVNTKRISAVGQKIICLPEKLIVSVISDNSALDVVL